MKTFGIGVVGTGIMGRRMLAALQQHPRFQVAALWDPDGAAALAASQALGGVAIAADLDALVQHAAVDAVYIASPPAFHLAGVQAAARAGKPCLCEKPLAHTIPDAQALRDLVVAQQLPLAVNFPFARGEASRRLLDLVQGGALGRVERATIRLRFAQWPRPWQAGASDWLAGPAQGGFTREVLSHFVFLALRIFGPAQVQDVRLERLPGQTETALQARLVHAGVTVQIDAAVAGEVADDNRFEIIGSQAQAALTSWSQLTWQGTTSAPGNATPATLDGLAALLGGATDHGLATVDEALAVVRCVEAMLAA